MHGYENNLRVIEAKYLALMVSKLITIFFYTTAGCLFFDGYKFHERSKSSFFVEIIFED